jgi:hypothetical protein
MLTDRAVRAHRMKRQVAHHLRRAAFGRTPRGGRVRRAQLVPLLVAYRMTEYDCEAFFRHPLEVTPRDHLKPIAASTP